MVTRNKGRSLLVIPDTYIMIDTETTWLSPDWDRILEISAIKVKSGKVINEFSRLIKYSENDIVPSFITELTGITTTMIRSKGVSPKQATSEFKAFVEESLIVGYNVNFDINFIFDSYQQFNLGDFNNDYVDVWRIARRFFKGERHNRVVDVMPRLGITHQQRHRALADCYDQKSILDELSIRIDENFFKQSKRAKQKSKFDLRTLISTSSSINQDSAFYQKSICFTGALSIPRKDAAQLVVNIGGAAQNGINKKTDYLVIGDISYSTNVKNGITGKMKRANELMNAGQDITILTETLFMEMLEEENA